MGWWTDKELELALSHLIKKRPGAAYRACCSGTRNAESKGLKNLFLDPALRWVIFPYLIEEHFCVAVIDKKHDLIFFYDSLRIFTNSTWLEEELSKLKNAYSNALSRQIIKEFRILKPRQRDSKNCAAYVFAFVDALLAERSRVNIEERTKRFFENSIKVLNICSQHSKK